MNKIIGKNISLRLVEIEDAEFILDLRKSKGNFLSKGSESVDDQKNWIKNYKIREQNKQEFYFIIENSDKSIGTIRIYDLKPNSFCWGSWAIKNKSPHNCGIESLITALRFGFYKLNYQNCHFEVVKENIKLVNFYKAIGGEIYNEDDLSLSFTLSVANFQKIENKYKKFTLAPTN